MPVYFNVKIYFITLINNTIQAMNNLNLKTKLFEACKSHQQKIIANLKAAMEDAQQSANEYGSPKDRYDSYRMQLLRKKDMFGQQLEKALGEFTILKKIDLTKTHTTAGFGAVVLTSGQNIFISIGIGKLIVEGKSYYVVSLQVPVCKTLVGKKKGDITELKGKEIKINDVF